MLELKIKEALFSQCEAFVNNRLHTIETIISSNQKGLHSETKSSAGDKHETGRAMLQLEMEKAGQQLAGIIQMKATLAKMDVSKTTQYIHLGSLIYTEKNNYFLSISAGQLTVEKENYYAVSVSSPIGRLLLGKQANDVVSFRGNTIKVLKII